MPSAVAAQTLLWDLRDYNPAAVMALNNADAQHTSLLDEYQYDRLLHAATFAKACGDRPDAFLVAMNETSPYVNANFSWFKARYPRFIYIDRVVVAVQARGQGLARHIYVALQDFAVAGGCTTIGCEVNRDPPNPVSDAFHQAMGFSEVGQGHLENGKTVRYLVRSLV